MKIVATLEGMPEVERQVRLWELRKRAEIMRLIEATAKAIAAEVESMVPVDSGDLKRTIKTNLKRLAELEGEVSIGSRKAFYAHMVEFGTKGTPAHPSLVPAFQKHAPDFLRALNAILDR